MAEEVKNTDPPDHWSDLTAEQRAELVEMANGRILSKKVRAWVRAKGETFKWVVTILAAIAAFKTMTSDELAEWVNAWLER